MKVDWKDDVFEGEHRKYNMINNEDGTVSFQDVTEYSQQGDLFGAKEMNEIGQEIEATKKSVSDGKGLIAAAITLKKIATAATDTFAQMAENIGKIVLGSGNAAKADVLAGKTFTNDDGVEYTGTMVDKSGTTQSATASLDTTNSRLQMTIPATGKYSTTSKIYAAYSSIRTLIGLTADKLWPGVTILGVKSSKESMAGGTYTPTTAQRTISCGGKAMTSDIIIGAIPTQVWTGWKQIYRTASLVACGPNDDGLDTTFTLDSSFSGYNTFIFNIAYDVRTNTTKPTKLETRMLCCSAKGYTSSNYSITDLFNDSEVSEVNDVGVAIDVAFYPEEMEGTIEIYYDGDLESTLRRAWLEVYLVAALTL